MTAPKDYNKLAQAVRCPQCDAPSGKPCRGALGSPVTYTHHSRRANAAASNRRDQRKPS
jgi:hypothetical protein